VHGAKGLEFEYVFIVNLVALRFPTSERRDSIELPDELIKEVVPDGDIHLEEERRLFYVAMTRAKSGLYLTSAKDYGGARQKKISRFLVELGFSDTPTPLNPLRAPKGSLRDRGEKSDFLDVNVATKEISTEIKLPIPKHFAYSQISSFAKCPLQYKYAYILKIPTFGNQRFSFGQTIHSTLQKFFERLVRGGGQVDLFGAAKDGGFKLPKLEELMQLYDESWIDAWYPDNKTKKEYKEKGKKILKEYYEVINQTKPRPVTLEKPFTLKIGGYSINGRVDRIDRLNGGVEIIDYKTGQAKKEVKDDDRDQLLIYQLAAEEAMSLKPERLTYYYIEEGKSVSFLGDEKDKEKIKEKIISAIEEIKTSDFTATPEKWVCDFCDYNKICEFRVV